MSNPNPKILILATEAAGSFVQVDRLPENASFESSVRVARV